MLLALHRRAAALAGLLAAAAGGLHAQPEPPPGLLSEAQLKEQLRPRPPTDEERYAALAGNPDAVADKAVRLPTADGRCDATALHTLETAPARQRNLEVVPATPSTLPQATLDLRFALASHQLSKADRQQLDALARALNDPELSASRYAIRGHTDSSGDPVKNLILSCARAEAVQLYLVKHGRVAEGRLGIYGFGSQRPVRPGNAADGANRRVEIRLER